MVGVKCKYVRCDQGNLKKVKRRGNWYLMTLVHRSIEIATFENVIFIFESLSFKASYTLPVLLKFWLFLTVLTKSFMTIHDLFRRRFWSLGCQSYLKPSSCFGSSLGFKYDDWDIFPFSTAKVHITPHSKSDEN